MKITTALVSAVFLATTLTACSGGNDYCESIKSADNAFGDLNSPDGKKIEKSFDEIHSLAKKAPSDVKADWKILDGAITNFRDTLKDAGISLADLSKTGADAPKPPDAATATKIQAAAQKFTSPEVAKANEKITKHAKKECKIDLDSTGS